MPALVRNTHVMPIWEGTTNVLSLDLLRATERSGAAFALIEDARECVASVGAEPAVDAAVRAVLEALGQLEARLSELTTDLDLAQAGARSLALGLATTYACARLSLQGAWAARRGDPRTAWAALRMAERGLLQPPPPSHLGLGMDRLEEGSTSPPTRLSEHA
jgi:hypothetical protein